MLAWGGYSIITLQHQFLFLEFHVQTWCFTLQVADKKLSQRNPIFVFSTELTSLSKNMALYNSSQIWLFSVTGTVFTCVLLPSILMIQNHPWTMSRGKGRNQHQGMPDKEEMHESTSKYKGVRPPNTKKKATNTYGQKLRCPWMVGPPSQDFSSVLMVKHGETTHVGGITMGTFTAPNSSPVAWGGYRIGPNRPLHRAVVGPVTQGFNFCWAFIFQSPK